VVARSTFSMALVASDPCAGRFGHLLQPIRDLSKVWKIEIADELEKYIEEVGQLVVTNPEDGFMQLNFAEAALLIQGSTAIYSRKVELLYQLVYQALDLLCVDRKDGGGPSKKGKAVQSGLWAPIPDTDELLTIDHLIKEGRNIVMDHNAPEQRQALQRRVPLFLMPRDQADRRKKEFRISSCTVHHTGVYLLQESDARLLDNLLAEDATLQDGHCDGPLVPAPPKEVQDLDNRLQELLREIPEEPEAPCEDVVAVGETPHKNVAATPMVAPGQTPLVAGLPGPDPWALLDEHEAVGTNCALEVGKTSRRLNAKQLLTKGAGIPDAGLWGQLSDEALWSGEMSTNAAPMLSVGNPVDAMFLSVAEQLKHGGRYETQRAGFSSAWLEFEDLFGAAAAKRRQMKATLKGQAKPGEAAPMTPPPMEQGSDDEGGNPRAAQVTPMKLVTPLQDAMDEEKTRQEEQRKEVVALENMIQEAQLKYEGTIRQHLQQLRKDAGDTDQKKFPQLYANVRRWQDQVEPVLKELEGRAEFDIHSYGTKFLEKMTEVQSTMEEDKKQEAIPFAQLVEDQPRWEVCRRFLTCLILTNHGNTDIEYSNEDERVNGWKVKLLKADKPMISLDADDEAAAAPAAGGRPRKAAKRAAGAVASGAKA